MKNHLVSFAVGGALALAPMAAIADTGKVFGSSGAKILSQDASKKVVGKGYLADYYGYYGQLYAYYAHVYGVYGYNYSNSGYYYTAYVYSYYATQFLYNAHYYQVYNQ